MEDNQLDVQVNEANIAIHSLYGDFKEGEKLQIKDFLTLFTDPVRFFRSGLKLNTTSLLYFLMTVVGIVGFSETVHDNVTRSLIETGQVGLYSYLADKWAVFWMVVTAFGFFRGLFVYWLGGWWYNVRLGFSGVKNAGETGRLLFMYNKLILNFPQLLLLVYITFSYSNYMAYYLAEDKFVSIFGLLIIALIVVSIINSYRSVVGLLPVKRVPAVMWFLVLPLALYGMAFLSYIVQMES